MGSSEQDIRTTFPIPHGEVSSRKWKIALGAPMTWAPFLPAVGAYAFLDAPLALVAAALAAITGGLVWFWKGKGPELEKRILEEMIRESNEVQDAELNEKARVLNGRGFNAYAMTLTRFTRIKSEMEKAIHSSGELTAGKEEVEKLVDSLCFGVADELSRMGDIEDMLQRPAVPISDERRASLSKTHMDLGNQVKHAFDTLSETRLNLDDILNPVKMDPTGDSNLEDVIERLKEETEIAKRVKQRFEADASGDLSSETTYGHQNREIQ